MKYPTRRFYVKNPEAQKILDAMPKGEMSELICAALIAQYSEDAKERARARLRLALSAELDPNQPEEATK